MLRRCTTYFTAAAPDAVATLLRTKTVSVGLEPASAMAGASGVARVVLQGPTRLNLMTPEFFDDVLRAADVLSEDSRVRVAVLHAGEDAAGKVSHFCAGLDLKAAGEHIFDPPPSSPMPVAMNAQRLHKFIERLQTATQSFAYCRVPVVAAINGHCIGGGVDLATGCDVRFCSRDAVFSVREVAVGIVADLGTLQRLGRLVGEGHARELAFTARDFDADYAAKIGLVNDVLADRNATLLRAFEVAQQIARNSPLAVQGSKKVLEHAFAGHTVKEGLDYVRMWNTAYLKSDDLVAAVQGFATKSAPQFSNHVIVNARKDA